jgi:hypothetical protein
VVDHEASPTGPAPQTRPRGVIATTDGTDLSFGRYVDRHTIVIPQGRVLFVPMPKAGCTSMLWALAGTEGLTAEHFADVLLAGGMSVSSTIHAMGRWPSSLRWSSLAEEQREAVLSDDWLRFTLVRDPARRLFSAWQSKLLLRDGYYVKSYGSAPWFPRLPESPDDVVEDFRAFVLSLAEPDDAYPVDVHWGPQVSILDSGPPLNHVGRLEEIDRTIDLVRPRFGDGEFPHSLPRENRTLIPFHPGLIDGETREVIATFYARDFAELGYSLPDPDSGGLSVWGEEVAAALPAVTLIADGNEQISRLSGRARHFRTTSREMQAKAEKLRGNNRKLRTEIRRLRTELRIALQPTWRKWARRLRSKFR